MGETLSVRDQLAIWLAVHIAGAVRMDVVELADQILAGPLSAWQETFKREYDSLWVSLAAEREKLRRVEALLRLAGGKGESGGVISGHALRRALDGDS